MNAENKDLVIWQITAVDAKTTAGKPLTVESFLTAKLGHSAGRRLYKELLTAAKDAVSGFAGAPAIDLTSKNGEFVSVQHLN